MTLIRELAATGFFTALPPAAQRQYFTEPLTLPNFLPDGLTTEEADKIIEEMKNELTTPEGCQRFRDLLQDMGILGSAVSRRIKAVAAELGIPIDDIEECLERDPEELEDIEDEELDFEMQVPEDPPVDDPSDCPTALLPWVCREFEPLVDLQPECETRDVTKPDDRIPATPFPDVPDPDEAEELCQFADAEIRNAIKTKTPLSPAKRAGYVRIFHALAFRPNPPPGIIYKRCTKDATGTLTEYYASGVDEAPSPAEQKTLDQINRALDVYDTEIGEDFQADTDAILDVLDHAAFLGITDNEAAPWFALIDDIRRTAILDQDEAGQQLAEELGTKLERAITAIPTDPARPPVPDFLSYDVPAEQRAALFRDASTTFANYLITRQAAGVDLTTDEQNWLSRFRANPP